MHELTITPEGHLLVRETSLATSDRKPSKRLLEAYTESPARRDVLLGDRGDGRGPAAAVRVRPIHRPALSHEPLPRRHRGARRSRNRTPTPSGRSRAGRSPGPAHDRVGVPFGTSPFELVARPGCTRPQRDQVPPRRHARLSARAQPAMAIRRSCDVASGREQAESGLSVRLSGHVRQRFDAAGQGEARTPGPGAFSSTPGNRTARRCSPFCSRFPEPPNPRN